MTEPVREQIFALIEARLAAIDGVAEVERMPAGDPGAYPALQIFDISQRQTDSDATCTRYALSIGIDGFVRQGDGAHTTLNQIYAAVVAALMTEPPLGGLAETIEEAELRAQVVPLAATADLRFALDFTVTFTTRRGDPAQPA